LPFVPIAAGLFMPASGCRGGRFPAIDRPDLHGAGRVHYEASAMNLKDRITQDMKEAMRAREAQRLSAIRMLLAAMKQREVDERIVLADADVLGIIEKLVKQRRDSITQYEAAHRQDLADAERFELELLQGYLPQQLGEAEIEAEIEKAAAETGAAGAKDMGKVMALLKSRLAGRADMAKVSAGVKARLSS
jgi:uncharacterized protein YqeY